jgi:hypothetical protein
LKTYTFDPAGFCPYHSQSLRYFIVVILSFIVFLLLLYSYLDKSKFLSMELCLDAIKELNAALVQLTNKAKEWNRSTSAMSRLPASLRKLWDEICTLKCLAADIQRSLQRGVMLDVDKCDLSCINQAVAAVSCLLGEACNSIWNSRCPTPSSLNPESLERYFKDIRDCRVHIEAILSPRLE